MQITFIANFQQYKGQDVANAGSVLCWFTDGA